MEHRVFVYGTLLRGEVNHHLLEGARCCGPHRTEPRFTLFALGAYPGVVDGGNTAVVGEVYVVNEIQLLRLDRLEDYPRLYDRRLIATPYGRAWLYLYRGRVRDRHAIRGGDWRCHARRRARGPGDARRRDDDGGGRSRRRRFSLYG
jgi:gamma-glutamylcyclotransferase (GGCT)/AIG2-like uncharacterized protein YtfP